MHRQHQSLKKISISNHELYLCPINAQSSEKMRLEIQQERKQQQAEQLMISGLKYELNQSKLNILALKNKLQKLQSNLRLSQQKEISLKMQNDMLQNQAKQTKKQYQISLYQLKKQIKQQVNMLTKYKEFMNLQKEPSKILFEKYTLKKQNKAINFEPQQMKPRVAKNNYLQTFQQQVCKNTKKKIKYNSYRVQQSSNNIKTFNNDYNQAQIQILKKINDQVGYLIQENRKLQMKIFLYEKPGQGSTYNSNAENIVFSLQNAIEKLVNYLLDKKMILNPDSYKDFLDKSRQQLKANDTNQYMSSLSILLKSLFTEVHELKNQEISSKAKQMMQLKKRMSEILERQIQLNQSESNFSIQQKYLEKSYKTERMPMKVVQQLMQDYKNPKNYKFHEIIQQI